MREARNIGGLFDIVADKARTMISNNNLNVLDCACGSGALSERLHEEFPNSFFTLVDINEISPLKGANFIQADLNCGIPFPDRTFDLILSLETIEHLNNPAFYLSELSRVLNPEGAIILSTPNIHNIFSRLLFLFVGELQWFRKWHIEGTGHVSVIYNNSFKHLAQKNNLSITSQETTQCRLIGTQLRLPLHNPFWGEISIYTLNKSLPE